MNTTIFLYLWLSGIATVMLSRHGLVTADCASGSAQCRRMRACNCGKSSIPLSCIRICVRVTGTQLIPAKSFNCRSFCNNCLKRPSNHNCYKLCIPPGLCGQQESEYRRTHRNHALLSTYFAPGKRAYELPAPEERHPFEGLEDSLHDTSINTKPSNPLNAFLPYHPEPAKSSRCVLDKMFLSYPPLIQAKIIEVFREAEKTLQDMREILDIEINFSKEVSPL